MLNHVKHSRQEEFSCLFGHAGEKEMDTVVICVSSFLSLVTLFSLVICCFKCVTKNGKGTVGDNPGGRRTGGDGADPGVIITEAGVNGGMSAGCACGTGCGNGINGCGGSSGVGGGGGGGGGGACSGGDGVC